MSNRTTVDASAATLAGDAAPTFSHRACLDGLRGLAVVAVVLFHLDLDWMAGGYLGVDVFFVLSGFLITTLLIREWAKHGRIDLRRFWVRRARRLLPASFVVLGAIAIFALLFATPQQLGDIRRQGLASLVYLTNWARAFDGTGYFDSFGPKSPLEHYWSLAIEEQFYLVWPLIVFLVFRWRAASKVMGPRYRRFDLPMWWIGAGGALTSAAWMWVLYSPGETALYFRTDTRVQALLVGVALAAFFDAFGARLMSARPRWMVPAGWVAAILLALASSFNLPDDVMYQGGFLLVAVLVGVIMLAAMSSPGSSLDRILSARLFTLFGTISYGLYLWHWPVVLLLTPERTGLTLLEVNVLRFSLSVALAVASLVLVETPVRTRRVSPRLELTGLAGIPLLLGVALLVTTTGAQPSMADAYAATDSDLVPVDVTVPDRISTLVVGDDLAASLPTSWGDPDDEGPLTDAVVPEGTGCGDEGAFCSGWQRRWGRLADEIDPDVVMVVVRDLSRLDESGYSRDLFDAAGTEQSISAQLDELATELGAAASSNNPSETGPGDGDDRVVVFVSAEPPADSVLAWPAIRGREAAAQLAARRKGAVANVALESLTCDGAPCPAPSASSGDPDALGAALGAASRQAIERQLQLAASSEQLRVLLLGDSVAWSIGSNFYGTGRQPRPEDPVLLWNRGEFACDPDPAPGGFSGESGQHVTSCPAWQKEWPAYIDEFAPQVVLVPASHFMIFDRTVEGTEILFDSAAGRARISKFYGDMIDDLSASGATVALTTNIPSADVEGGFGTGDIDETQRRELILNEIIAEVVADHSDSAVLIDLAGWICDGSDCKDEIDGIALRPDGSHFTPESSPLVGRFLSAELVRLADERRLTTGSG